jgi:hypothetical protein
MLFLVQFFLIAHLSSKVGKGPELAHMLSHYAGLFLQHLVWHTEFYGSLSMKQMPSMEAFLRPPSHCRRHCCYYWPQLPWQHCLSF